MESLSWSKAIKEPAKEFSLTNLKVIEGSVPKTLKGVLYRNGPGRLERGGRSVTHWFDGDGAILGIWFGEKGPSAMYKYVKSEGYKEEEEAGEFLYRGFNLNHEGFFSKLFRARTAKNAGNTSVLSIPGKLLTLWEGGWPHNLDPETLETKGLDNLNYLEDGWSFSAHPKVDATNGDIFNFGHAFGMNNQLLVYRMDKNGKLLAKGSAKKERITMMHDFVLAGKYLVFLDFAFDFSTLGFLSGMKSYHQALEWKPEHGTEIFIFEKESLTLVNRWKIKDSFFVFHYVNGCVDKDGNIILDMVKYEDFAEVDYFTTHIPSVLRNPNVFKGKSFGGHLATMKLDPIKGKVIELKDLDKTQCEFPVVADHRSGLDWRYSLVGCHTDDYKKEEEFFKGIGRFDKKTGQMTKYYLGEHRYPGEPIIVAYEETEDNEDGFVITLVYDAKEHASEIWILKSEELEKGPVCRLLLPSVVPFGFHGRWNDKKEKK